MNIESLDKRIRKALNETHISQKKGFYTFDPYKDDAVINYLKFTMIAKRIIKESMYSHIDFGIGLSFRDKKRDDILRYVTKNLSKKYDYSLNDELEFWREDFMSEWQAYNDMSSLDHINLAIVVPGFLHMVFDIYPDCIIEKDV